MPRPAPVTMAILSFGGIDQLCYQSWRTWQRRARKGSAPCLIAGLGQRYNETSVGIPALWQHFVPTHRSYTRVSGLETYGVMWPLEGAEGFEYVCGVEVSDFSAIAAELAA
jgi:predicted transcriptional regulator YdeE